MKNELPKFEKEITQKFNEREKRIFSDFATYSKDGARRYEDKFPSIRPSFSRDADRILHSFAFTRYIDKTQVFYLQEHDFITHRVIHVQLVSKIARIIGRALGLNEDLIEAIALGHDIGHTPFGHEGEENLSKEITTKLLDKKFYFHHSVQSVRFLNELERGEYSEENKRGLNLTLQVLDGILCHDGEDVLQEIHPNRNKSWADFDAEVNKKRNTEKIDIFPITLEGCLVRFADVIAYVGRDVEDAIAIGLLKEKDVPQDLGRKNREIVNTLVMDIIENSIGHDYIAYSDETFRKLKQLWEFNYDKIYLNPLIKSQKEKIKDMFLILYNRLLDDLRKENTQSPIFTDHINFIDRDDAERTYYTQTPAEIIVIDYLAGMTDDYFINTFEEIFFPRKLPFNFSQIERTTGLSRKYLRQFLNETNLT